MKKYLLPLIALCLLIAAGQQTRAQVAIATAKELAFVSRGVARAAKKGNPLYKPGSRTGLYSFQVTHLLKRRADRALQKARQTQQSLPPNARRYQLLEPVAQLRQFNSHVHPLVEDVSYVNTPEQARLYLTAQENRLYVQQIKRFNREILPQLEENLSRLRQAAARVPQPANPMAFLAQAIPAEVNTLAIGEIHNYVSVQLFIAEFLSQLRNVRPEQEIILFAEALPQEMEYSFSNLKARKGSAKKIWQTALDNNIRIIGLEPREVLRDVSEKHRRSKAFFLVDNPQADYRLAFFISASGVKWRNEMFTKTIQKYRAEHPDALFIIYTGNAHVDYRMYFSLTADMDPQKTFVLSVLPAQSQVKQAKPGAPEKDIRFLWDPFSFVTTDKTGFEQPLLYFEDPQLARIAGANAYIRTELESFPNWVETMRETK